MTNLLSPFNWSLKKALSTETDSLVRSRIRIAHAILVFSLLKAAIVLGVAIQNHQSLQAVRAAVAFCIYVIILKLILSRPDWLKPLAHTMLVLGILLVWSNIFVYAHNINLVTLQFVFMIMLSSFYTLGNISGIVYSIVSTIPVLIFFLLHGNVNVHFNDTAQELASPGFEIIVFINFVSIIIVHYLFYHAYRSNITEKENLNQKLQMAITQANKLAESRSNFLSTMSHELRTPLNSVIGITELLMEDAPEERQIDNLNILKHSAHDLLSLINNILDFNKIDAGKQVLESFSFPLADLIQNICAGLQLKARGKKLDFILDIDAKLQNISVSSDPTRLAQLIYNLVSNAIKFTDKGSIIVKLECVNRTAHEVEVLFSVTDTGIGIHPDKHETIFELFTQAETHTTRKYGGTGLGLAIVKQILVLFNSSLRLESSPGKGSKFYFAIPFAIAEENAEIKKALELPRTDMRHLKILLAEDNDVNRMLMKKQLEKLEVKADMVQDGQQAYETYLSGNYDAIFMDLHMPIADGYETTKKIRALADPEKANVYIVAFTASITEQESIMEAGFDDFLYKPVNMNDLQDKLEKIAIRNSSIGANML